MTFLSRAASLAAFAIGLIGTVGLSTPGFARDLPIINAPIATVVPVALVMGPAAPMVQPVPAEYPDLDRATASSAARDGDFATLDAAVAGQTSPAAIDEALRCLAASVYYEAKGEPLAGQLAVAEVIINRAKSGKFPGSICSVVTQPGQFSFVKGGAVPSVGDNAQWHTAVAIAQVALADAWDSPATGALYFHARRVAPGWRATKVASIGNHVFFR